MQASIQQPGHGSSRDGSRWDRRHPGWAGLVYAVIVLALVVITLFALASCMLMAAWGPRE